jgi:hypothetical protein
VQHAAVIQGRVLGATDAEIAAAVPVVAAALTHPLLRRAAAAQVGLYAEAIATATGTNARAVLLRV